MYDVSPDGADSSTKVDLSRRVIRLSGPGNSTPLVTSHGAGGSPDEAIIRLLMGVFVTGLGHF